MPRTNRHLLELIAQVAAAQLGLITAAQLAEIGYPRNSITHRARQGGPWIRVLPGVYLVSRGALTHAQRLMAAVLYAKSPCGLTGLSALTLHGVESAARLATDEVHLLTPHARRRLSRDFVRIERTVHWPATRLIEGVPVVGVARAAIDGCRQLHQASEVNGVLAEIVQRGHASTRELRAELATGQRQRTALARDALDVLERGPASAAEIDLYRVWVESEMPEAMWNVDLLTPAGAFLARPDVYLPDAGVAFELDSLQFHYSREDWERTMQRHTRMTSHGVLVLHATPSRVRTSWPAVRAEVLGAISVRTGQPPPTVIVRPARAA